MFLLIRYGEIGLKSSQVKSRFEERLEKRLEEKLSYRGIEGEILESEGRIFAEVEEQDAADASLALSRVPGVVSVSPAVRTTLELDDIAERAVEMLEEREVGSFAIDARRAGEHDYTSEDLEEEVGQAVVDSLGLEVDLDEPDVTVHIEARYRNSYLYTETVDGVGGLPVNEEDRVAVLMEDRASTVAAFLLMKRGCRVFPVYTGEEPKGLEEEMEVLHQFDPGVKLTVMKGEEEEVLEQVSDLYECQAVAVSAVSDELEELPETEKELLLPNSGFSEEEVMEKYRELTPVRA
ncbi:MAG: THUMP domain-containing protein [Candidatus Nanohaloarchaea archaeon]|nr:THUMP domain-containing protein [Candidatus Nanohaloarchaea archaeon]